MKLGNQPGNKQPASKPSATPNAPDVKDQKHQQDLSPPAEQGSAAGRSVQKLPGNQQATSLNPLQPAASGTPLEKPVLERGCSHADSGIGSHPDFSQLQNPEQDSAESNEERFEEPSETQEDQGYEINMAEEDDDDQGISFSSDGETLTATNSWGEIISTDNAEAQVIASTGADVSSDEESDEQSQQLEVVRWQDRGDRRTWIVRSRSIDAGDPEADDLIDEDDNECSILQELSHPHIIKTYGYELSNDNIYIKTRLCMEDGGEPISHALKQQPQEKRISSIQVTGQQLCEVLSYLQQNNILHRDIKPDNILSPLHGVNLKVIDFGSAWDLQEGKPEGHPGTPMFAAPEVLEEQEYDFSADTFSAGRTLLELMMNTGIVDSGWIRSYKRGSAIQPSLSADFQDNPAAKKLLAAIQRMVDPDPKKTPLCR